MSLIDYARIPVWTGAGAVLLFVLMYLDSLFTGYHDMKEIKEGNIAVTTRFIMKLFAQAYILAMSIGKSNDMWEALLISIISFVLLLVLEWIVRFILSSAAKLQLDQGIHQGKIGYALFSGSLHIAGALIIGSV
jgi:uncharacterized membrane protein YjfL (UPF0719 family)